MTVSTACASGTNSIGRAAELIDLGRAEVMLAGGADLFTELSFSGFNVLGAMTRGVCQPIDRDRDGMVLGDGAAMVVLESESRARARGARIYAFVAGHALANEAYHPTAPRPDGSEAARVMLAAIDSAGLGVDDIDYVNLHGTGTEANNAMELAALRLVFGGERSSMPWLSSIKAQVGHTLGAAGSVEVVATALALHGQFAPPGIHLEHPIVPFESWPFAGKGSASQAAGRAVELVRLFGKPRLDCPSPRSVEPCLRRKSLNESSAASSAPGTQHEPGPLYRRHAAVRRCKPGAWTSTRWPRSRLWWG